MNLRKLRCEKGFTQFALGKQIDLHPQRISEIERGKADLKLQEAIRAAEVLNVSLDELAGI